jgi:nicotinic acid phosphoribosyltransferase
MHIINNDIEKVNWEDEWNRAYNKCFKCLENGVRISDMSTRRRFSFENQELVLNAFKQARQDIDFGSALEEIYVIEDTFGISSLIK